MIETAFSVAMICFIFLLQLKNTVDIRMLKRKFDEWEGCFTIKRKIKIKS